METIKIINLQNGKEITLQDGDAEALAYSLAASGLASVKHAQMYGSEARAEAALELAIAEVMRGGRPCGSHGLHAAVEALRDTAGNLDWHADKLSRAYDETWAAEVAEMEARAAEPAEA